MSTSHEKYKVINTVIDHVTGNVIIDPNDKSILCYLLKEDGGQTIGYVPRENYIEATSTGSESEGNIQNVEEPSEEINENEIEKEEEIEIRRKPGHKTDVEKENSKSCGQWTDAETRILIEVYPEVADTTKDNLSPVFWKKETGTGPITWPYFDLLHSILFVKPEINPVATASSIAGYKRRLAEDIKNDEKEHLTSQNKKKKKNHPEWLQELRKDAALRHEENLELKNKFISSFIDYVELLKKK
ncbi:uncharacterized protein LOC127291354 isoform X2 [Leptopilina boulardi]|uniref:uncharacterized protein LOC127291354 isoform X2 n=1 Tax=Leptopilina boulardi TaxID=63433 RepID=UPI0021F5485E|nr:uncharacterized protein LOC127291354 isoform X2 [Leptopilina boulardi]